MISRNLKGTINEGLTREILCPDQGHLPGNFFSCMQDHSRQRNLAELPYIKAKKLHRARFLNSSRSNRSFPEFLILGFLVENKAERGILPG